MESKKTGLVMEGGAMRGMFTAGATKDLTWMRASASMPLAL